MSPASSVIQRLLKHSSKKFFLPSWKHVSINNCCASGFRLAPLARKSIHWQSRCLSFLATRSTACTFKSSLPTLTSWPSTKHVKVFIHRAYKKPSGQNDFSGSLSEQHPATRFAGASVISAYSRYRTSLKIRPTHALI